MTVFLQPLRCWAPQCDRPPTDEVWTHGRLLGTFCRGCARTVMDAERERQERTGDTGHAKGTRAVVA